MSGSNLSRRLWVAGFGIPLGVAIVYAGGWVLAAVLALLAGVGTWEVYRIAAARGWRVFPWLGVPGAVLLVLGAQWTGDFSAWSTLAWALVVLLTLASLGTAVFLRGPDGDPLPAVAATVFGVLYAGATLSFAVFLRRLPEVGGGGAEWAGAFLLIFPLAVTWVGDSAAFFVGRRWGRRKLIPVVSPGKTVEGGIGGLLGAMGAAALYALVFLGPGSAPFLPVTAAAVLGLLIGAVAQVGDLAESVLKREAGVKDSGGLLPGHGGVLDRFDAIYFTVPLTYALLPLLLV
jgi:phosphatidate cytidylyltransferase